MVEANRFEEQIKALIYPHGQGNRAAFKIMTPAP
jgi:hypothetical protein